MSKSRSERAAALEAWADSVAPEDLKVADPSDLKAIARLSDQRSQAEADLVDAVRLAHGVGRSWSEIGVMLGVSKQAAQRKYGPAVLVT